MTRRKLLFIIFASGVFFVVVSAVIAFFAGDIVSAPLRPTHRQPELRSTDISSESGASEEKTGFSLGTDAVDIQDRPVELANETEKSAEEIHYGPVRAMLLVPGQEYIVWVPENSTVYDLMSLAEAHSESTFRGKNFWGLGFFVEEINGLAQNPKEGMYWIYYINGEKALVGVSQYIIKANDVIEWKYEAKE